MSEQNFKNHARYVPLYHFITSTIIAALIIAAGICLIKVCSNCTNHQDLHNSLMFFLISMVLLFIWWYCRVFALKAQDRAIRAEENFRHFVATGKPLDRRLKMGQIVALRFAGDDEFVTLAKKAVEENMDAKAIKMAIKNWKADNERV